MKLSFALDGVTRLLLDTAPVIYHTEEDPFFGTRMAEIFRYCREHTVEFVTTPVTLAECLIHPLANGAHELAQRYEAFLLREERTTFHPIGIATAREAARLRTAHGLRLADALQVAVALETGCDALLTNDSVLSRVTGIRILQISEIEV